MTEQAPARCQTRSRGDQLETVWLINNSKVNRPAETWLGDSIWSTSGSILERVSGGQLRDGVNQRHKHRNDDEADDESENDDQ